MRQRKAYEYNPNTGNDSEGYRLSRTGATVFTSDTEDRLVIYGPKGNRLVDKDTKQPFGFVKGEM